jgi:dTDP-4-dehydrorhamnose 3,5-epimerase-like enzyme
VDERVLRWSDPALGIDWGGEDPILSARDQEGRTLAELADMLPRFEPA